MVGSKQVRLKLCERPQQISIKKTLVTTNMRIMALPRKHGQTNGLFTHERIPIQEPGKITFEERML